jgi:hypothetical protein
VRWRSSSNNMDNEDALILLAASLRNQIDTLERFIQFVERHREAEELRKENEALRKRVQELETR